MPLRSLKRISIFLLFAGSFTLSIVYLKVYFHARAEFQQAEQLLRQGDLRLAIRHYGYVIRWYTPGNRYVSVAIRRIRRMGTLAYQQGNWALSLFAYQHISNALSATRGIYQPHATELAEAQTQVAKLLALLPGRENSTLSNQNALRKELLKQLQHDPIAHPIRSLLAVLSFLLWWTLATILIAQGSRLPKGSRRLTQASAALSFVLWLVFLSIA